jgi:hypothetical protein
MRVFSGRMSRHSGSPRALPDTFPTHFDLFGSGIVKHILSIILGYNVPESFLFSSMFSIPISSILRTLL